MVRFTGGVAVWPIRPLVGRARVVVPSDSNSKFGRHRATSGGCGARDRRDGSSTLSGAPYPPYNGAGFVGWISAAHPPSASPPTRCRRRPPKFGTAVQATRASRLRQRTAISDCVSFSENKPPHVRVDKRCAPCSLRFSVYYRTDSVRPFPLHFSLLFVTQQRASPAPRSARRHLP